MNLPQTNHCFRPAGFGTSDLPGQQFEDGDRVAIPAQPAFMFAVRAAGTGIHAIQRGGHSNLEKVELMPGDTAVVPGKTNRETYWTSITRGMKDWSQILYQFGLNAAAIKTLRN